MSFIHITAGSGYGRRTALYEVVEGRLVMRHEGDQDNLAGNSVVTKFEGLTIEEAQEKRRAINNEPTGHQYDGCHCCQFSVSVEEGPAPDWYTYQEPDEAEVIRQALAQYRNR